MSKKQERKYDARYVLAIGEGSPRKPYRVIDTDPPSGTKDEMQLKWAKNPTSGVKVYELTPVPSVSDEEVARG